MNKLIIALGAILLVLIGFNAYVWLGEQRGVCVDNPEACDDSNLETSGGTNGNQQQIIDQPAVERRFVNVYFIKVAETEPGQVLNVGEKMGCGDTVIPVRWEIEPTRGVLKAVLEELIELGVRDVKVGPNMYYNALYQSELKIDSAAVEGGVATVKLSGELRSGGVCDDPRIVAQLKETVEQFPTVESSKIFINNQPLETYFSAR